ncbi:hypothetical protein ABW21_db0202466 [Orbilia brochopaga]|nr:hypothetical protein ABW21_db0202466 [Drechslerella brochopaga]
MSGQPEDSEGSLSFISLLFDCSPDMMKKQVDRDLSNIRKKIRAARKSGADDSALIYTIDKIKVINDIYTGTAMAMVKARDSAELYHISGHALDRLTVVVQDMENVFAIMKDADARARGQNAQDNRRNDYEEPSSSRHPKHRHEEPRNPGSRFERDPNTSNPSRDRDHEPEGRSGSSRRKNRDEPSSTPRRPQAKLHKERRPESENGSQTRTDSRREANFHEGSNRRPNYHYSEVETKQGPDNPTYHHDRKGKRPMVVDQADLERHQSFKGAIGSTDGESSGRSSQRHASENPGPLSDAKYQSNGNDLNRDSNGTSFSSMIRSVTGADKKSSGHHRK